METWVAVFVILGSLALVLQAICLLVIARNASRVRQQVEKVISEAQITSLAARHLETISQMQALMADAQHVIRQTRSGLEEADHWVREATKRLRLQLIQVDQTLTGVFQTMEGAQRAVRRTLRSPVVKAGALIHGIREGIRAYRDDDRSAEKHYERHRFSQ